MTARPQIFTIPPDQPFARKVAQGLLESAAGDSAALGRSLILLPTRRACRSLREAFLAQTEGKPLLLPRLQPLGDIDAEELSLSVPGGSADSLQPAIDPARRLLLLARLVAAREGGAFQAERHIPLARALARLMDQTYTENLALTDLPRLVDGTGFADHWQITLDFLAILSEQWPAILAEEGAIDAADRRNRLIRTLADHWRSRPPDTPVMAAGSTGSIPATADLLGVIAHLPHGAVILPGLDQEMADADWDALDETHPQAMMKRLLQRLDCPRTRVQPWPATAAQDIGGRVRLAAEMMRPAARSNAWQALAWPRTDCAQALAGLHLLTCETAQDEAQHIAFLLRETLETPGKTALVVTPDRGLAARIAAAMKSWGVQLDDSAGQPLNHSAAAQFFRGVATMMLDGLKPAALLAVLKHPLCRAPGGPAFVQALEKDLLRGVRPPPGPQGLLAYYAQKRAGPAERSRPNPAVGKQIEALNNILSPFYTLMQAPGIAFGEALAAHMALAETLAGADRLWQGDEGEALAVFLSRCREQLPDCPPLTPRDYALLLEEMMQDIALRPAYGTHPRLAIMGQLEARIVQADRVILAGLNEGSWPPDPGMDPFLSRPMKREFGLPPPERAIGLAAHDFVQNFCAGEVYVTRARRTGDGPAVPARWLARLETVMAALDQPLERLSRPDLPGWQAAFTHVPISTPIARPAPCPAVALRPDKLSVTQIETWLKDPYSIFARAILGLSKLDPVEQEPDAARRGSAIHAVLEQFIAQTAQQPSLSADAPALFLSIARDILPRYLPDAADQAAFWPRLVRLAPWFSAQENRWRQHATPCLREAKGRWTVRPGSRPFTLSGIADRIDRLADGTAALIDYKSGGASQYTAGGLKSGKLPQLPLEALMLAVGAFEGLEALKTGTLSYWITGGGMQPGRVNTLHDSGEIEDAVSLVEAALYALIIAYENPETPYYSIPVLSRAPRFNDYAHLARIQEWSALEDAEAAA